MARKGRLVLATAIAVAAIVGVAIYLVGRQVADPGSRGQQAAVEAGAASAAGDPVPAGQSPVTDLTMEAFQRAFNAVCDWPRLLVMLSPT